MLRTSGPFEQRVGVLSAPAGRAFGIGDTLALPPVEHPDSWRVVAVDVEEGVVVVESAATGRRTP